MITIILCILLLLIIKNRNNHLELVDTRQIWYCHTCSLKPLNNGSISIVINSHHSLDYHEDILTYISDKSCGNKFGQMP